MDIRLSQPFQGNHGEMDFAVCLIARKDDYVVAAVTKHSLQYSEWISGQYFGDPAHAASAFADLIEATCRTHVPTTYEEVDVPAPTA